MGRFQFRLQRVLDYRSSLVEAQEAEVYRHLTQVSRARAELQSVHQRQTDTLAIMASDARGRLDPVRGNIAWTYLDRLRQEEGQCRDELDRRTRALAEARRRLTELKQEEQVIQRLKDRRQERARIQALRDEVKELDDITATRHALDH